MGLSAKWQSLFPSIGAEKLFPRLKDTLIETGESVVQLSRSTMSSKSFKNEIEQKTPNPGNPKEAGWTFLCNANDPNLNTYISILEPLARHRGMSDPDKPLLLYGTSPEDWEDWLYDTYFSASLTGQKVPLYILIVGDPDYVPFQFQALLDLSANVGRVAFDSPDELENYVEKVLRIEQNKKPVVKREALVFATDSDNTQDPIYYSKRYMAEPFANYISDQSGPFRLDTHRVFGKDATKANFLDILHASSPSLVFTASHGLGDFERPFDFQKRYHGSITTYRSEGSLFESIVSADDVPSNVQFLEGSIFFQFACFGYGTPTQSNFSHWFGEAPEMLTKSDFISALPKKLLANPRGPLAYIGHVDTAYLHGFADPDFPDLFHETWHSRIAPFKNAIQHLLETQPIGYAMKDINERYSLSSAILAGIYDRIGKGKMKWSQPKERDFINLWVTHLDARNYMILGDPAVRLRIPTSSNHIASST